MHPQRYYFAARGRSDTHAFSQRTRFIPDELLPKFSTVAARQTHGDRESGLPTSEMTTADIRRRIGKMWA
jgi:DNA helicase-2/ATP-dependent DNA helicase PcrA